MLRRLRAGDPGAREELVRACGGRLLALARRLLILEEDARDLVGEAFQQAFRKIRRFRGDSPPAGWLEQILRDAAHRKLRADSRGPEASLGDLLPRYDAEGHRIGPVSHWPSFADNPLDPGFREQVRAAIGSLPACHRAVLTLRDLEDLSADQAAQVLGLPRAVVNERLHRARQALRARLDALFAAS